MSLQKKSITLCLVSLYFLLLPSLSYAQNFYKWIDAKGSTHYTTTPPPKNAKKLGKVMTYNDRPSGSNAIPPAKNANTEVPQQQTPSGNPTPSSNQNQRIPLPPQQQNSGANQPLIIQNNHTAL